MSPKDGVIKLVAMISKKSSMTSEAFEEYYEEYNVPLSLSLHSTFSKYTRNYIKPSSPFSNLTSPLPSPCDAITEVWLETEQDFQTFLETAAGPDVRQRVIEDESQFMDRGSLRMFAVTEREG
jgi:EthD domain